MISRILTSLRVERKAVGAVTLLVAGGLVVPKIAFAGPLQAIRLLFGALGTGVDGILNTLSLIIAAFSNALGSFFLPLAAGLLNWSFEIGQFIHSSFVQTGWGVTRDFANMFFILVLLVIAFATILRFESYGIKKLIPRFIAIALLINFSLVIGGVFIDIGSDVGWFFVTGGAPETRSFDIGANIMAALNMPGLLEAADFGNTNRPEPIIFLIQNVAQFVFIVVATFLFVAMALFMVFRMVILWLLLIIAPIAWISYLTPATQEHWKKWWREFLGWAFFPAVLGFFIYLALVISSSFTALNLGDPLIPGEANENIIGLSITQIVQWLVVIIILFYGLIHAKSMSLSGMQTATSWVDSGKSWALGKAKQGAKYAGGAATQAVPEEARRGIREGLEKTPGVGRLIGGPGARHKKLQDMMKEAEKDLGGRRPDDLKAIADQTVSTPKGMARRATAIKMLAEKGKLEDKHKNEKYLKSYLDAGGNIKDILSKMPSWAFDEDVQSILAKHPSTKKKWGSVAQEKDASKRYNKTRTLFRDDYAPDKPKEFAKTQKVGIDIHEEGIEKIEKRRRQQALNVIIDRFKEGGDYNANHLNALANENLGTYEVVKGELEKIRRETPEALQKGILTHLEAGPGPAAVSSEESEEKTEESGSGEEKKE